MIVTWAMSFVLAAVSINYFGNQNVVPSLSASNCALFSNESTNDPYGYFCIYNTNIEMVSLPCGLECASSYTHCCAYDMYRKGKHKWRKM